MADGTQPDPAVDARFGTVDRVVFVIGAQKSGTTWLYRYLAGHGDVLMSAWKELDYWNLVEGSAGLSRDLTNHKARIETRSALQRLRVGAALSRYARKKKAGDLAVRFEEAVGPPHDRYADVLFAFRRPGQHVLADVSPQYALLRTETFAAMSRIAADVRFILLMRDPVDRFLSGVRHTMRKGGASDFAGSAAAALEDAGGYTLLRSRYERAIDRLEAAVPADRIGYFFYETFFDQAELDRLCGFIGVAPRKGRLTKVVHRGLTPKDDLPSALRVRARAALEPTYRALAERFGPDLPAAWRRRPEEGDHV